MAFHVFLENFAHLTTVIPARMVTSFRLSHWCPKVSWYSLRVVNSICHGRSYSLEHATANLIETADALIVLELATRAAQGPLGLLGRLQIALAPEVIAEFDLLTDLDLRFLKMYTHHALIQVAVHA
jgi:hypothetical protein